MEDINAMVDKDARYAFVVFTTGAETGWVSMHACDYSPTTADAMLKREYGSGSHAIAALEDLRLEQISALNVIFDNVSDMRISTRQDLERVLSFHCEAIREIPIRSAIHASFLPEITRTRGDTKYLPIIQRLFDLYLECGDDSIQFESAAERETVGMEPARKKSCMMIFQIAFRETRNRITETMTRWN